MIRPNPICRSTSQQFSICRVQRSLSCPSTKNQMSASYPMTLTYTVVIPSTPNSDSYWITSSNPLKICSFSNSILLCSFKCSSTPGDPFLPPAYWPQAHSAHGSLKAAPLPAQTKCLCPNFHPTVTSFSFGSASQEIWKTRQITPNINLLELNDRRNLHLSGRPARHNCKSY